MDGLASLEREKAIAAMNANTTRLYLFVDDVWTREVAEEKPDWKSTIETLEEARLAGQRWGSVELSRIAARGIAAIQDEYLGQKELALGTLADTVAKVGDGVMLRYQRGMLHYQHKEFVEAYDAWLPTLETWPAENEDAALYAFSAFSGCGAAAGFLSRWEDADRVFSSGRELALKVRRKLDALKFDVDYAYAQWRANFRKEAIASLAHNLGEMEKLGRVDNSTAFHTQWKLMEHVIAWCSSDAGAPHRPEMITPRPGICSESKTQEKHDLVKDAPRGQPLLIWYCLAEAELYAGLGRSVFSKTIGRADVDDYPQIRPMIAFLRETRALADGTFDQTPLLAESTALAFAAVIKKDIDVSSSLKMSPTIVSGTASKPAIAGPIEESLLHALLAMSARETPWQPILSKWHDIAPQMQTPEIVTTAIATIEHICNSSPAEIYRQCAANTTPRFTQMISSLRLAVHPESKPALCYVGFCALVTDAGLALNALLSHDSLAKVTRRIWLARLAAPFELLCPRLTVPAIKSACESDKEGRVLAALILLAVGDAVQVNKSADIPTKLAKIAAATNIGSGG